MAKQKRKVTMPAGIRNKMMAAVSMLMVSAIMMVSSTYAWFTLSTAPEVKNIKTTVAGNGSLEIALMPTTGVFADIGKVKAADGTLYDLAGETSSNTKWGNIVNLGDDAYGLSAVSLNPAMLNAYTLSNDGKTVTYGTAFNDKTKPLAIAAYGQDGRMAGVIDETVLIKAYESGTSAGFTQDKYGVRAIGEQGVSVSGDTATLTDSIGTTYGYIVDLAFRMNTAGEKVEGTNTQAAGKLLLQTEKKQRIYNDAENSSQNAETLGGGSYMKFNTENIKDVDSLMSAVRVTFVQNFGKGAEAGTNTTIEPVILGTAKLDLATKTTEETADGQNVTAKLYLYDNAGEKSTTAELVTLEKNKIEQISAIVWLDGNLIKNSSVSYDSTALASATLNLQFSTDVTLHPANNNVLFGDTSNAQTVELGDDENVTTPENNGN